jgi:hypothetical protein
MDEDFTIPQYKVVDWCADSEGFEKEINRLAVEGYEVVQFSTSTRSGDGYLYYTALMVKRVSRLEVLVKDGKAVQ